MKKYITGGIAALVTVAAIGMMVGQSQASSIQQSVEGTICQQGGKPAVICSSCNGTGKIGGSKCLFCNGRGFLPGTVRRWSQIISLKERLRHQTQGIPDCHSHIKAVMLPYSGHGGFLVRPTRYANCGESSRGTEMTCH